MHMANESQLRLTEQALERIRNSSLHTERTSDCAVAYRRMGQGALAGRKIIRCPYCGESIRTVGKDITVRVYRIPSKQPLPRHSHRQCVYCRGEIGIVYS